MKAPLRSSLLPALLMAFAVCASLHAATGRVRGEVTDTSGGVLPGVGVELELPDGTTAARTTTDAQGRFAFDAVPEGTVTLTFALDAFQPNRVQVTVVAGRESLVVERLTLAALSESVVVYAEVPARAVRTTAAYVPAPRPQIIPVEPELLETVCRPARVTAPVAPLGIVQAHRYESGRTIYAKGDELVIAETAAEGLEVGRNFLVTRVFHVDRQARYPELGAHTAGLVQVVSTGAHASTAVVVHACNELMKGDMLLAFTPLLAAVPEPAGQPAFDDAARILFGDAAQLLGSPRRHLVIDRGSDQGLRAGQRLTLFRSRADGRERVVLGEAIVVGLQPDSATIRVEHATDVVEYGDYAAPHRVSG